MVLTMVLDIQYVNRTTDIQTLKHYVSEVGSFSFFRQEAPNLLDPLDQTMVLSSNRNSVVGSANCYVPKIEPREANNFSRRILGHTQRLEDGHRGAFIELKQVERGVDHPPHYSNMI